MASSLKVKSSEATSSLGMEKKMIYWWENVSHEINPVGSQPRTQGILAKRNGDQEEDEARVKHDRLIQSFVTRISKQSQKGDNALSSENQISRAHVGHQCADAKIIQPNRMCKDG